MQLDFTIVFDKELEQKNVTRCVNPNILFSFSCVTYKCVKNKKQLELCINKNNLNLHKIIY